MAMEITARPRRRGWLRAVRVVALVGLVLAVLALVPPALGFEVRVADGLGEHARGSLVLEDGLEVVPSDTVVIPYLGYPLLALGAVTVPPWTPAAIALGLAALLLLLRRRARSTPTRPPPAPVVEPAVEPFRRAG